MKETRPRPGFFLPAESFMEQKASWKRGFVVE